MGDGDANQDADQGVPNRGRKSVPWRRDPVILARLVDVERRHLLGEPNTTIALALGVDETTIRRDVERLRELWRDRTAETVEDLKARKVAELSDIYRRAIAAAEFDELCERAVLFGLKITGPDGNQVGVFRDAKGSAQFRGNKAAALGQARQAIMDQAKILGLVVEKVSPTKGDGSDLDLASLLQKARELRAATTEEPGVGTGVE